MTDYWEYLKKLGDDPMWNGVGSLLYDALYDSSHGADRYALSKLPFFSWHRKFRDAMQEAQDQYDNTGKDPAYSTRLTGPGFESLYGGGTLTAPIAGMARSLASMYTPEIVENVEMKFNGMYR